MANASLKTVACESSTVIFSGSNNQLPFLPALTLVFSPMVRFILPEVSIEPPVLLLLLAAFLALKLPSTLLLLSDHNTTLPPLPDVFASANIVASFSMVTVLAL